MGKGGKERCLHEVINGVKAINFGVEIDSVEEAWIIGEGMGVK